MVLSLFSTACSMTPRKLISEVTQLKSGDGNNHEHTFLVAYSVSAEGHTDASFSAQHKCMHTQALWSSTCVGVADDKGLSCLAHSCNERPHFHRSQRTVQPQACRWSEQKLRDRNLHDARRLTTWAWRG